MEIPVDLFVVAHDMSDFMNLVNDAEKSLSNKLQAICTRLHVTEGSINAIATEMFNDGKINWGRIATLYAFCKKLCVMNPEEKQLIVHEFNTFIVKAKPWCRSHSVKPRRKVYKLFVYLYHIL